MAVASLGFAAPSAQAAPASGSFCAGTHTPYGPAKASHDVKIRPAPVASEANNLGTITKGQTVTLVNGHWDSQLKQCTYFVRDGENHRACSNEDNTWYQTVWIAEKSKIGYIPAPCLRG
ncbi:hypothetical protein [Allokutzneria sp. NRRL B-24872]|uniref:hypothetical protein n=1 Tax=Allokutzneria sp. NRRL B-24872 TaxID=1137961 RepID=UPI0011777A0A|nr:hypothetical protein [Allokutzneria sp. NRRL B-24872]